VLQSGWQVPASVSVHASVRSVQLALLGTTGVMAVWDDDATGVWAAAYDWTNGWSPPQQLSGGQEPYVVADSGTSAVAAWLQPQAGSSGRDAWAARYISGAGWSTPLLLDAGAGTTSSDVRLAADAAGLVHAVWFRVVFDCTVTGACAQLVTRRAFAGAWTPQEVIDAAVPPSYAELAAGGEGHAIVLVATTPWSRFESQRFRQGAWGPSGVVVDPGNSLFFHVGQVSALRMDATGTATVLVNMEFNPVGSTEGLQPQTDLVAMRNTAGASGWSGPNLKTSTFGSSPWLADDPPGGNLAACWLQFQPRQLWCSAGDAKGAWTKAVRTDGTSLPAATLYAQLAPGLLRGLAVDATGLWSFAFVHSAPANVEKVAASSSTILQPVATAPTAGRSLALWIEADPGTLKGKLRFNRREP
jgi:hypothetical protein